MNGLLPPWSSDGHLKCAILIVGECNVFRSDRVVPVADRLRALPLWNVERGLLDWGDGGPLVAGQIGIAAQRRVEFLRREGRCCERLGVDRGIRRLLTTSSRCGAESLLRRCGRRCRFRGSSCWRWDRDHFPRRGGSWRRCRRITTLGLFSRRLTRHRQHRECDDRSVPAARRSKWATAARITSPVLGVFERGHSVSSRPATRMVHGFRDPSRRRGRSCRGRRCDSGPRQRRCRCQGVRRVGPNR